MVWACLPFISHLWCPNDPRGSRIDDDDVYYDILTERFRLLIVVGQVTVTVSINQSCNYVINGPENVCIYSIGEL